MHLPPSSFFHSESIVVTGATGWVGRSALHELEGLLEPTDFQRRVRAFASRSTELPSRFPGRPPIAIRPLQELTTVASPTAILHTAFLTRDRIAAYGVEKYVAINRSITEILALALSRATDCRVALVSSGAAALYDGRDDVPSCLPQDPYGVLKYEEERVLSSLAPTLVLRAYALSGRYMRDPGIFALGEFLLSARDGSPITLRSSAPVIRGYGHAGDLAALAWHWLFQPTLAIPSRVNAVSEVLDLLTLAQRITHMYQLPPVRHCVDTAARPTSYSADPAPFCTSLRICGREPLTLSAQIQDTALGLGIPSAPQTP